MTKDEVAMARYGVNFDSVSAWAQAEIEADLELNAQNANFEQLSNLKPRESGDLPFTLDALGARLANLEVEVVELWNENADLRAEVVSLQDELQKYSS